MGSSTVQIWADSQLLLGSTGCKQYTGLTPAECQTLIFVNNSDLPLLFKQPSGTVSIQPRTQIEIPTAGQVQYTLNVVIGAPPSAATDQFVTLQESFEPIAATTSFQLPVSVVSQFLNPLGPAVVSVNNVLQTFTYPIGPQMQTLVMFDKASNGPDLLTVTGAQSGIKYYNGNISGNPVTVPLLVSIDPLLDTSIIFTFREGTGASTSTIYCYGVTAGLQEVVISGTTVVQIAGKFGSVINEIVQPASTPVDTTGPALQVSATINAQNKANPAQLDILMDLGTNADSIITVSSGFLAAYALGAMLNGAGTGMSRAREITTADAAVATGLLAVVGRIFNGTNYDNPRGITTSDGVAATGIQAVVERLWNGASFDLPRSTQAFGQSAGHPAIGQARLVTYSASYRAAARAYSLSHVFAGAGAFGFATLYHLVSSTKNLRLKMCRVWAVQLSAVTNVSFDLYFLSAVSTPATGNPAITPTAMRSTNVIGAEAAALALPTTGGSIAGLIASHPFNAGITGAGQTANPSIPYPDMYLWPPVPAGNLEIDDPFIPAGTAGGFTVLVDVDVAVTIRAQMEMVFVEE